MSLGRTFRGILYRNKSFISFVRMVASILYLGPWRRLVIRILVARSGKRRVPFGDSSAVLELDGEVCLDGLRRTGYSGTFRFSPDTVEEVIAAIPDGLCDRSYDLHLTSPAVRSVAYDPNVISMVSAYMGVAPIVFNSCLAVANPSGRMQKEPGRACTRDFHYDVGDFRSLTLFLYLNDVDDDGGPHVLIPSSNRSIPLRKFGSRFMGYGDAVRLFGEERMVTVTGLKGTAFLEDLVNWHKRSLSSKARYSLSVTYTLHRKPECSV